MEAGGLDTGTPGQNPMATQVSVFQIRVPPSAPVANQCPSGENTTGWRASGSLRVSCQVSLFQRMTSVSPPLAIRLERGENATVLDSCGSCATTVRLDTARTVILLPACANSRLSGENASPAVFPSSKDAISSDWQRLQR